ncbi:probable stress response protein YvgO at C-terminar half [Coccomyxa sp. Obi]|nr:probable stress response protein YvgO at C-terminar half [Coccomyxa sp. Obi]
MHAKTSLGRYLLILHYSLLTDRGQIIACARLHAPPSVCFWDRILHATFLLLLLECLRLVGSTQHCTSGGRKLLEVPAAAPGGFFLDFNVDRNGIGPNVTDAISKETQVTREAFFKNLVSTIYYTLNSSYNVLAANINHDYLWTNQQGTILYAFGIYQEIPIGVWAFTSGNFVNMGSDDPSNWAFLGRYSTNGTTVSFKQGSD